MKKCVRRVAGLALALVLVCGSGLSARAAAISDVSGKEFISGSNGTIDQYVKDIAPKHVAVLAQLGSIEVCAEYGVSSGIQQFTFDGEQLVPDNRYYYLVYGDDRIVGVITARQDENGSIVTSFVTGYVDVLNAELVDSDEKYILISTGSALYLVKGKDNAYLLEHLDEYEQISDMQNIEYGDLHSKEIGNAINTIDVASIPAAQTSVNLNVPIVRQYVYPICWAASMASIMNYVNGTSYTATNVANATGKGFNTATYDEVKSYYTDIYHMSITEAGAMTSSKVYECLDNGQPIQVCHYQNPNTVHMGHSMVLTGAFQISSDLFYVYMDPDTKSSSYRTIEVAAAAAYDGTKLGIDAGGTTMYWNRSIYDIH